jgi:molybdopterin converting factor small subunit
MTGAVPGDHDRVTVLLFASARTAAGTGHAVLALAGRRLEEVPAALTASLGPDLGPVLPSCAFWVNGEPAGPGTVLREGDEVAVLPPVSGG